MPGIAGIATAQGAPVPDLSVRDFSRPLQRHDWYGFRTVESDNFSCASVTLEDCNSVANAAGVSLVLDGQIYGDHGPLYAPDLLTLFQAHGIEGVQGLNGSYVIVIHEANTGRLSITTDRLGYRPFYYWKTSQHLYFGTEYKVFYAAKDFVPKLRTSGLAQYLQLTYVFAEDTLLENVHQVPPASTSVWDGGELVSTAYEQLSISRDTNPAGLIDELAEEYDRLIFDSVRKRMGEKNVLLLTGGLDSRCLGGTLRKLTDPTNVFSCTMGYERSFDVRFGAQLASTLGFAHEHIPIPASYMSDFAERGVERLEGCLSAHGNWAFAADPILEKQRVSTVLHGLLGDSLAGERALRDRMTIHGLDDEEKRKHIYTRYYATTFGDDALKAILKKHLHDEALGSTWSAFNDMMDNAEGENFYDRVECLDLRQRQRHFTAQQVNIYSEFARGETPFADRSVVDFAMKLPQSMRIEKVMYKHMIKTRYPEVARIPYTATGLPLNGAPLATLQCKARNFFHYRMLPTLSMGLIPHVHYGVWIQYDRWLREASEAYVRALLLDGSYLDDILEMDVVRNWIEDHMSGRENYYGQLCILMTLALWRKRFNA